MSGPSRSERLRRNFFRGAWQPALFGAFLVPLFVLFIARYAFSVLDGLELRLYAAATGLELALTWVLAGLASKETITLRRAQFLDYINRAVLGLPFTVYLTVAGPHTAVGLVRFLTSLYAVPGRGVLWIHGWFAALYCVGLLFVSAVRNDAIPTESHVFTVIAAAGAAVLIIRSKWLHNQRVLAGIAGGRRSAQDARRFSAIQSRLKAIAGAVLPRREAALYEEGRQVGARLEQILLLSFGFPGFDDRASEASPRDKVAPLEREWDRFLEPLKAALVGEDFFVMGGPGGLQAVRVLADDQTDKEQLALGIAVAMRVLSQAGQFRRAEESRGRRLWHTQIALATGNSVGLSCGGGNPSWTYRGRVVREAENHLKQLAAVQADANWDSLWIHEDLWTILAPFFQNEGGGVKVGAWQRAGALRPDLAADSSAAIPTTDFVARARYSRLI